ncbi:MAG: DNA polymerase III subunit alpha [bacterium]
MHHADFVHLHTHTEYSLLDGAIRISDLIRQAHEFKMPAVAITDHGNMFGAIEFYREAMSHGGVKPIIGCEVYVAPHHRKDKSSNYGIGDASYHLLLLAANEMGYRHLMELSSIGYLEGFYYKPRVDKEILAKFSQGLIAFSGCLKGEVPYLILKGQLKEAREAAKEYQRLFGQENFFLELHRHGIENQDKANEELIRMSRELSIPLVASNDAHYLVQGYAEAHDALLCLQTGKNVDDTQRLKFSSPEFFFKNAEEMKELFSDVPEAITNTIDIAQRCNLELDLGKIYLPPYQVPAEETPESYLTGLCEEGLKRRYKEITDEIRARLDHELKIIIRMGYTGYFLIVWDFIRYAKEKGIPVGPGRGSAAGSLVAYCLGITDIDPLKYGLLFERFLNPERVSMPDIDIDFSDEGRDEVIDYVVRKYGKDKVTQIITFGTMAARAAIRDVARVLSFSYSEADKIAKLIPAELKITLKDALNRVEELKEMVKHDPKVKKLFDIAITLEGLTRHASTHAAAVVIAPKSLTHYTPLYQDQKSKAVTTQYDMHAVEAIGLLKMDFLGLKTLTVIKDCLSLIEENQRQNTEQDEIRSQPSALDLAALPMDDEPTYQLLSEGNSLGLFQLESSGMRDLLRKMRPACFEDMIALVALYRPGPLGSGMVDEFIKGKHGKGKISYLLPQLEPILQETHGVIVYQEQVMQIASSVAGFSLSQADELRKAMGKKIQEKMEKMRGLFVEGAKAKGIAKTKANDLFELMSKFAEYGFNKSHSAAYALIAYQTAYLKAHYPVEFMAALLTSEMNDTDKINLYIREAKKMGLTVLPPDVNESYPKFRVVKGKIRFGLAAVKNVGFSAINSVVSAREKEGRFKNLINFCERVDLRLVNKKVIESLIKCGAFDSLGRASRASIAAAVDKALSFASARQKEQASGQTSLFDLMEEQPGFDQAQAIIPDVPEWSEHERLAAEKEVLGLYITGHPLAKYEQELERYTTCRNSELSELQDGDLVTVGGIVASVKEQTTKRGNQMAYVGLEDLTGPAELLIFDYQEFKSEITLDRIILVEGKVNRKGEKQEIKIEPQRIIPLSEAAQHLAKVAHIRLSTPGLEEDTLLKLKQLLTKFKGSAPVYFHLATPHHGEIITSTSPHLRVTLNQNLASQVEEIVGEGGIWYSRGLE